MALSVKDRIERGEDPESARFAALREFGNVTLTRESMRAVWRPRWFDAAEAFWRDIRVALRSLRRAKGLALTVAVTLALGIGANAAIFSVVRQVLFRPLVNRDEDRLVYIRQSAPGTRRREHDLLDAGNRRPASARHRGRRLRRLLHHRVPDDRRRRAARGQGGRGRRLVLRRDGPASGARPAARCARRWPRRGRRGGPDLSILEHGAQSRSVDRSAGRSASGPETPPWSACSSRRCRIRPTPRSSRTW